jgi:acetyl-CoA C-acetyltransferase
MQDAYALESHRRATAAWDEGRFDAEVLPVQLQSRENWRSPVEFRMDESVRRDASMEALARLKPAFKTDGTVTAGNAPGMNDGAAAVVLMPAARAKELGLKAMATIKAQATSGIAPRWVMLAPVLGVRKVLERAGWRIDEVDLFELNEAFAVQALSVTRELGIELDKVNVNGGAVAIGHPIGASGARVLVTLLHEMMRRNAKKGVAALCLGGGNSVAMAVERE